MRRTVRSWLGAAGAVTALGGWALGQAAVAGPAVAAPASRDTRLTPAYVPPTGTLSPGMHGPAIRSLQHRLAQLHYYPGPADGQFGSDTLEAVWAFKEVQGIPTTVRPNDVGRAMKQALVHPRPPRALRPRGGSWRIEIHLSLGYLVLYRHNVPELISHISPGGGYYYPCPGGGTCGPAITPDGDFRAHWFAPGWVQVPLGQMYNPVFFIGGAYAIHGDVPVPLAAVSHGCVRIPMDVAGFFYQKVHISEGNGTPIYIRGRVPGT
jgi:peptidoglycan hydrolase-like protein with peptidoglycan-binding domain